ncbi:MAG TPA: RsmE family RNA methyltransferase [Candidatus Acidoferrales bacterium]|jgi:16S rRNA (uracil1498-N3)-methyltransferase|nr:RsmE family RNA methyltransferase [Candidatus Acidoferrales bacterium]
MRRRFFTDKFENSSAFLRGETAHHLARVLRAEPGQLYELSDGSSVRLGKITRVTRDEIEFALAEEISVEPNRLNCTLLLSIVKFDRFEWAIEKATELGVNTIVPLASSRSEKSLVASAAKRSHRWEKILIESAQQARRLRAPLLLPISSPHKAFLEASGSRPNVPENIASGIQPSALILLSERREARSLREALSKLVSPSSREEPRTAALAIGPEGGWTDEEFAAGADAGFAEASLGGTILRTETAVTAALASLNYALGD